MDSRRAASRRIKEWPAQLRLDVGCGHAPTRQADIGEHRGGDTGKMAIHVTSGTTTSSPDPMLRADGARCNPQCMVAAWHNRCEARRSDRTHPVFGRVRISAVNGSYADVSDPLGNPESRNWIRTTSAPRVRIGRTSVHARERGSASGISCPSTRVLGRPNSRPRRGSLPKHHHRNVRWRLCERK